MSRADILQDIHAERERQLETWGEQRHNDHYWTVILGEEYGEVCRAVFEGDQDGLRAELVQVVAVAVAWLEDLEGRAR